MAIDAHQEWGAEEAGKCFIAGISLDFNFANDVVPLGGGALFVCIQNSFVVLLVDFSKQCAFCRLWFKATIITALFRVICYVLNYKGFSQYTT